MPSAHPRIHRPVLGNVLGELITNCVIAFFTLIVVGLRILGRRLGPGLGWDDLLVVITTVCPAPLPPLHPCPQHSLTVWQPMLVLMVVSQGLRK